MKTFIIFAGFVLLSVEITIAQRPLYTFPFGIEAYTFRRSFPFNPAKTLDTIKSMGFTEIEGVGGNVSLQEYKNCAVKGGSRFPPSAPIMNNWWNIPTRLYTGQNF